MLWFPSSLILEKGSRKQKRASLGRNTSHALPSERRKVSETGAEGTPEQWSSPGSRVLPRGHVKMAGNTWGCHIPEEILLHPVGRDAAKHPPTHTGRSHVQCQWCHSQEWLTQSEGRGVWGVRDQAQDRLRSPGSQTQGVR